MPTDPSVFVETGEATAILPVENGAKMPVTVIGTKAIRDALDDICIRQTLNCASAPGVTQFVLNPDAHAGYGAPVGSVLASPTHVYPGPVGVDIKCSMSLLQLDLPEDAIASKPLRRALIQAILDRTPTGAGRGNRNARKGRYVSPSQGRQIVTEGATDAVLVQLGIPLHWAQHCEDSHHTGHDGTHNSLLDRVDRTLVQEGLSANVFADKVLQLGSYGGGNHFGECEIVRVDDAQRATADHFGLRDGYVAFLSHCGSRGLGSKLADRQFRAMEQHFSTWGIPLPGGDRHMVHAPLGTPEADAYLDDMAIGANFATVNHLLINALVLEAFQEVIPGVKGELVYFISHNIARQEVLDNKLAWVHRKGATRAFPAGHPGLKGTLFEKTGHPILLPGNPTQGSSVMVAQPGAKLSCYSVNHGAGRRMSRTAARNSLDQQLIDKSLADADIMTNCRQYPIDEAPGAYKDFDEVLASVEKAGLATQVARLQAKFVIKDGDKADD